MRESSGQQKSESRLERVHLPTHAFSAAAAAAAGLRAAAALSLVQRGLPLTCTPLSREGVQPGRKSSPVELAAAELESVLFLLAARLCLTQFFGGYSLR